MNGMVYPIILEDQTVLQLCISICIYFSYILISGDIPSMAHWRFWLSPSPQLSFFSYSSVS